MSEDNIQKALGRIEGKVDMVIGIVKQQGEHLLKLQELKLDIAEKDKILADSNEAKKVIHEYIEKQGKRITMLERVAYIAIGMLTTLQALQATSLLKLP